LTWNAVASSLGDLFEVFGGEVHDVARERKLVEEIVEPINVYRIGFIQVDPLV
jgi:hypothetical protein